MDEVWEPAISYLGNQDSRYAYSNNCINANTAFPNFAGLEKTPDPWKSS